MILFSFRFKFSEGGVSIPVVPDPTFTIKLDDINDNKPSLVLDGKSVKCYENITAVSIFFHTTKLRSGSNYIKYIRV